MDQMNMDCMDWNVENGPVVDLKKAIRGRLNKLTPENYDKISKNILEMEVDTEEKLSALVQIIFDKAVDDPICSHIYAPIYAELCKLMFEKEVPSASGTGKVSFRKLLLERCQQTFEKETKDEEEIVSKQKALEEADTEEKKKELQMELNERIAKTKRIMSGNIRFIGELFKLRMLTIKIMNFCISKLLKSRDEEQLECLCKLIFTIGKTYEEEYDAKYQRAVAESKRLGKQLQIQLTKLDVYLDEMRKLSQSEDLSSRIRFMLMDVLDLKQNRWVPRREGEKPKKRKARKRIICARRYYQTASDGISVTKTGWWTERKTTRDKATCNYRS
ncbi:eukaryotic translation initiation factor 4 gamma 1-like [Artemia franciscana]|uniref:eukaryotic translation initiation factor 4 gamma 1-like n=1 Tax=Artemia franciscana TaxID=6661 RepID=UPI0032DB788F